MKKYSLIKVLFSLSAAFMLLGSYNILAGAAEIKDPAGTEETAAVNEISIEGETNLPSRYSSVELGYVTGVKSQQYQDCWAYAGLAALESKLLRNGYQNVDMSVPHLNFWATTRSNGKGWIRNFTDDGFTCIAPGYFTSWQGGVLLSDALDINFEGSINGDDMPTDLAKFGVTSIRYLNNESREAIKQSIMDNGGVVTGFGYSPAFWDGVSSYYMPQSYNQKNYVGHAIEIVGWDDGYSKENFIDSPENDGAWLVKNSWGSNASVLDGYFWMSYENKYIFSDTFKPSYTINSFMEINDGVKLIQNEIYGATYEFDYIKQDEVTFLNRFEFDKDHPFIDKIMFKTECIGSEYTIYYVPDKNGAPAGDPSEWTALYSDKVGFSGYICADIDDYELSSKNGSIAVKIDCSGIDKTASIGVGEWLVLSGTENYRFINETERGQSYIYKNGYYQDILDWYKENQNDELGGTLVIKAITTNDPEVLSGDVNLDGVVDITDATEVQRRAAELIELSKKQFKAADMNGDGVINVTDATEIQIMVAE